MRLYVSAYMRKKKGGPSSLSACLFSCSIFVINEPIWKISDFLGSEVPVV